MGIGHTVGTDKAVVAEIIVGSVETVEVAAVGVYLDTALAFPAAGLVDEVPDETTLQVGILADDVPIFLETTLGVAHGVGILALYEGTPGVLVLPVLLEPAVADIHGAIDVGVVGLAGAFVLAGARGILGLHPLIAGHEVVAVAGLVAE